MFDNLDRPPAESVPVTQNNRAGALFFAGANAPFYVLNSLELPRPNDGRDWSSLRPAVYTVITSPNGDGCVPDRLVGILTPASSPQNGLLEYVADEIVLNGRANRHMYSLVLDVNNSMINELYPWSVTDEWVPGKDGWSVRGTIVEIPLLTGTQWDLRPGLYPQFALNVTPIPEPSTMTLFALGAGWLLAQRKRRGAERSTR